MKFIICLLFSFSVHGKDLIPLQDFFKNPVSAGFSLSPNGKKIAYLKTWDGRMNIFVRSTENAADEKRLSSVKDRDIASFFWKGDSNILYQRDFGGDENFHLFRINIATGEEKDLTPFEKTRVDIIDDLSHINDNEILISNNKRDPKLFDVYRLNLENNSLNLVYKNPGDVEGYLTDLNGKLRVAIRTVGADTEIMVRATEKHKFQRVLKFDYNDAFVPILFSADGQSLFALSNLGRDKIALVEYDLKHNKEARILYQSNQYDIDAMGFSPVIYSYKQKKLLGVNFLTWRMEQAFFDPATEDLYKLIHIKDPSAYMVLLSQNKNEDKFFETWQKETKKC